MTPEEITFESAKILFDSEGKIDCVRAILFIEETGMIVHFPYRCYMRKGQDYDPSDNATILTEIQECVNNPAVIQAAELARTQINAVDTSAVEL